MPDPNEVQPEEDSSPEEPLEENVQMEYVGEADDPKGKMRESARGRIGMIYVLGFFLFLFFVLLIGLIRNWTVDEHKDMLLAISGTLVGPLGFIVGHYFKDRSE